MNWLKKLFKRKNKIPEFEPFIKLSNEEVLADFEADPLDLSTTTKVGTFNDKPLFYSPQVPDGQILGINKSKEVEGGVCYGPILG